MLQGISLKEKEREREKEKERHGDQSSDGAKGYFLTSYAFFSLEKSVLYTYHSTILYSKAPPQAELQQGRSRIVASSKELIDMPMIQSFSFSAELFTAYRVPGTVPYLLVIHKCVRDTAVNKEDRNICPLGVYVSNVGG